MDIFISWSGGASKAMAQGLSEWLPTVIQAVRPFFSSDDIQKGTRWFSEIGERLDKTDFGILCLTRSNLSSPWIHFEAGALSKKVERARVIPFLIDVQPSTLVPPLSAFNAVTSPTKEEVKKLVHAMNSALGEGRLTESVLLTTFERAWPEFERTAKEVQRLAAKEIDGTDTPKRRPIEDMLDEMLILIRGISAADDSVSANFNRLIGLPSGAELARKGIIGRAMRANVPQSGSTNLGALLNAMEEKKKPKE